MYRGNPACHELIARKLGICFLDTGKYKRWPLAIFEKAYEKVKIRKGELRATRFCKQLVKKTAELCKYPAQKSNITRVNSLCRSNVRGAVCQARKTCS